VILTPAYNNTKTLKPNYHMNKKILLTLTSLILLILPFLIGNAIGKYSPYVEGNSFQTYVIIWAVISMALAAIAFLLLKYAAQSFESIFIGGAFLFLLACPIVGIIGLVSAPDLSIKMLNTQSANICGIFIYSLPRCFLVFSPYSYTVVIF
jgi:hypothetical protein